MPEVSGEAGLLTDHTNPVSIADAMRQIEADKLLREKLIHKGIERSKLFSWDKTTDKLWHSLTNAFETAQMKY